MRFYSRKAVGKVLSLVCWIAIASLSAPTAWGARSHRHTPPARTRAHSAARLAGQIDALLAAPIAAQAHWGISVTTLDGRVVYEKNDAQLFAPASNAKLLATSTALALLGSGATIETRVIAAAAPDAAGTVHGDVTLVGAGDASMSGRAYPYNSQETDEPTISLGALELLADQLQQRGVRRVEGNIVGDDSAFPWEPYGSGWAWDDLAWSWGAPVSALTVNDNVVYLTVTPGAQSGDPLMFAWDPAVTNSYYQVNTAGRTSAAGSQSSLGLDRQLGTHEIRIFGTLPVGSSAKHLALAIQDPADFAAIAFRQMLASRGIAVGGTATAHHRLSVDTAIYEQSSLRPLALPMNMAAPAAAGPLSGTLVLASRTSVPLLEDITVTNKVSQNLHAEILLRLLGKRYGDDGSVVEGARVVRAFLLRAGVEPQDFFFYDGSGLSPDDRIAPRALTALLRYAAAQPWGAQFRTTLPVGGMDGTLSGRFKHSALRGRVFAKTGTLDEVNSLSGYVTAASGQTLVFSILCNGHMPGARGITPAIDGIVTDVAAAE